MGLYPMSIMSVDVTWKHMLRHSVQQSLAGCG